MKLKLKILVLLCSTSFYAQINYERGYFIDNSNNKKEGFVKNREQMNNPVAFEFKENVDDANSIMVNLNDTKEVAIYGKLKYVNDLVDVDISSNNRDNLGVDKDPKWVKKQIFLKVVLEGEATLYEYIDGNLRLYFYKVKERAIQQLIHKEYLAESSNVSSIKHNNEFQKQLYDNVNFGDTTISNYLKIEYKKKDLFNYFVKYNEFKKSPITKFQNFSDAAQINIRLKGGFNASSLAILFYENPDINLDFGKKTTARLGGEIEFIFPFNRNKWGVFVEASYQSGYKSEKEISTYYEIFFKETHNYTVDYSSLDLLVGPRYYMFLSKNAKLFLNASLGYSNKINNNNITRSADENFLYVDSSLSLAYGLGFSYKKFNVECRINNRNILIPYIYIGSRYNNLSMLVGYTIFNNKKNKK